jgi:hypothetical protein
MMCDGTVSNYLTSYESNSVFQTKFRFALLYPSNLHGVTQSVTFKSDSIMNGEINYVALHRATKMCARLVRPAGIP